MRATEQGTRALVQINLDRDILDTHTRAEPVLHTTTDTR